MRDRIRRIVSSAAACIALILVSQAAVAQDLSDRLPRINVTPFVAPEAPAAAAPTDAMARNGRLTLAAKLTSEGKDVSRGMIWRVFDPVPGPNGKLSLVASAKGGTQAFDLAPGQYLVHASFGRAGATKRITVGDDAKRETFVLDAGGLQLDAVLVGGARIPPEKLRFSIYEAGDTAEEDRALILPDVSPNTVIRLNSGTYHVVSTYGAVNAVIRSDIRVEAGKLTQATVEHRAAEITFKLVREAGGEAIADTAWSVLAESGDPVRETVGAFASMVLAEGKYTVVAKNRDRIYQRDLTVVPGRNQDVEVLATDANVVSTDAAD